MIEVGNIIRSRYAVGSHARARIGIVIKLREGAYEDQPLAQVYWPHRRDTGWVEAKDMEVVSG
jgi:hypothetical protein